MGTTLVACGHATGEIDIYDEAADRFTKVDLDNPALFTKPTIAT
jgi:hypothetical protein